jgi:hypothetical protein
MNMALEGGEGSAPHPGHSLPPGKTRYPLYRRLGRPQGRSAQVLKIPPPPPVFAPRTVQPIVSRYTDYATWPTFGHRNAMKFSVNLWPTVWECAKHFNTNDLETDLAKNKLLDRAWRNSCGASSLLSHVFFN